MGSLTRWLSYRARGEGTELAGYEGVDPKNFW